MDIRIISISVVYCSLDDFGIVTSTNISLCWFLTGMHCIWSERSLPFVFRQRGGVTIIGKDIVNLCNQLSRFRCFSLSLFIMTWCFHCDLSNSSGHSFNVVTCDFFLAFGRKFIVFFCFSLPLAVCLAVSVSSRCALMSKPLRSNELFAVGWRGVATRRSSEVSSNCSPTFDELQRKKNWSGSKWVNDKMLLKFHRIYMC